ncbi:MAG: radical SAM protein, partial [Planctomycetes bacterium]|nr:radical SAM protein [Planctomycetota bacterium]
LGEPAGTPLVQPDITQKSSLFSLPILGRTGYVFAGLGCPNGCDFCATSHFFKREHIRILPDGPSIVDAIRRLRELHPGLEDFWISDEDFLLSPTRGRGFLEAIRASGLPPLSLKIFSSVKALSQYRASELVEMGVDWVWVGFEGKRAGYAKMRGRPYGELFADLHRHGISVLASMIIGFDYQTPEIIREEYEELLSYRPTMSQFLIYGPAHGTPSYDRMKAEGRLDAALYEDHTKHDGFSLGFRHPFIGAEEMSAIQRGLYREEFERLGPSVFRTADDWLAGYLNLRDSPEERVRAKALRYGQNAHRAAMLIPASRGWVSETAARWLDDLRRRIAEGTGRLTLTERLGSLLVRPMPWYTSFKLRHGIGMQPKFTRKTFRTGAAGDIRSIVPVKASVPIPRGG